MNRSTNTALLTVKDVLRRRRSSRSTLYIELKLDPDMPEPVKIGRRTFFVEAEIDAWLAKKVDQARAAPPMDANP